MTTRFAHYESCGRCHQHPCACPRSEAVTLPEVPICRTCNGTGARKTGFMVGGLKLGLDDHGGVRELTEPCPDCITTQGKSMNARSPIHVSTDHRTTTLPTIALESTQLILARLPFDRQVVATALIEWLATATEEDLRGICWVVGRGR